MKPIHFPLTIFSLSSLLLLPLGTFAGEKIARDGHHYTTSTKVDQPQGDGGQASFLGKTSPETQHWQAELEKARASLIAASNRLNDELARTPDFAARSKAITDAQAAVDQATQDALAPVRADPKYQESVRNRDKLRLQADQMKQEGTATASERTAVLSKLTTLSSIVRRMEDDALKNSATLQDAKTKLSVAQADMLNLRSAAQSSWASDPQFAAASTKVEECKSKLLDASARANKSTERN